MRYPTPGPAWVGSCRHPQTAPGEDNWGRAARNPRTKPEVRAGQRRTRGQQWLAEQEHPTVVLSGWGPGSTRRAERATRGWSPAQGGPRLPEMLTQGSDRDEGSEQRVGRCPRGLRVEGALQFHWVEPGLPKRPPSPPIPLVCLPSPAGTGFCSPGGGRVAADWPAPVSSPTQPINGQQCFSS